MKTFEFKTTYKKLLADILTPVSLYLKLRDRFPQSILLESSDYHGVENSYSFICLEPVAQFKVDNQYIVKKYPDGLIEEQQIKNRKEVVEELSNFISSIKTNKVENQVNGFFGYTAYNSINYFEKIQIETSLPTEEKIPEFINEVPPMMAITGVFSSCSFIYYPLVNARNSASSMILMPSALALSSFEPASSPATI